MSSLRRWVWKAASFGVLLTMLVPVGLILGPVQRVEAANTGYRSPTANAVYNTGFTNPTYAYANDSNYASRDNNANGVAHVYSNYGFSVPSDAVIQGIQVRLDWWLDSTTGSNSIRVYLSWNGGTNWTAYQTATTERTSDGNPTDIVGGATHTWGRTWTPAEFNDANFRVRLELVTDNTGRDFRIDWVPVQVTYNRQPNTPTNTYPNGQTLATRNPTFTWSAFSDPDAGDTQTQFYIQVRQNPGSYFYRATTVNSSANSYASSWNLPDGAYCWQVRVTDNSGASNATSALSSETCFTVSANQPPNPPTLVDPPNGEVVITEQPTLSWNATTDPDPGDSVAGYSVSIDGGAFVDVGLNTNYTPAAPLSNGSHSWQVRACDTHAACSTSPTWSFTVNTNIIGPNQDSYIDQVNPGSNYGPNTQMYVRSDRDILGNGENRRMFLRFNLPAITTCYAGTSPTIVQATLRVYADSAPSALRTYEVQRVTESWTEGGIAWNNQPDTTGNATDATNVNSTGWVAWNVTADVQNFGDYGGTETNYGWMIKDAQESASWSTVYETRFRAREYSGSTYDPQLLIAYNCPPSAPVLVSPVNGGYTNDNTPLLDWNPASDPDGDTLRYSVSVDGGPWTSPSPDTQTEITWSTLGEGQHNWQVRAYDGRTYRYSENWTFTVDTDTPATPDYLNEGSPDQDYYPNTAYALTISWGSVPDTGSGITYQLQRRVNGGGWTDRYTGTSTTFADTGSFSDNDWIEYQVRARTGAGIYSDWRPSDGLRIDSTDPAIVTGVGEGVAVGADDDWNRDNVYWVYWNRVPDTGSGIAYEVQRSVNGGAYTTLALSAADCDATRCWGDDPTGYSNGDNVRYRVRAVNGAGRTSLDWSAPSDGLAIDSAAPDSGVTTGGVYTPQTWPGQIVGTASDAGGSGVVRVEIRLRNANTGDYWNGTAWQAGEVWVQATGTTGWSYLFPAANLTDGHTYVVDSRAADLAGNVESTYGNNNFTYSSSAPDAPVPTSPTHPDPDLWYADNQPGFVWNEPYSSVPVVGYSIILDTYPGTIPDTIQDTTQTVYNAATTPDGTWYFHVRAVNIAGTWGPAGHVRVNIDTATPQTPATVTEENPDVDWDADGAITVYWSAVPNTGSGITYALERCVNGGLSGACTTAWQPVASGIAATLYAHNPGGYGDGDTVRYRVRATNGVGLTGGWRESDGLTVDSSPVGAPAWVYEDAMAEPDRDYHNQANGAVTVRWATVTDTGSGITYRLDKCVSLSGACANPTDWALVAQGLSVTAYADAGSYSDGLRVRYRVTAVNGVGTAGAPTASDGMLIDLDIPASPAWVHEGVATDPDWDYDDDGAFTVYWAAVANTGSGITYRLEKSVDGADWQTVAEGIAATHYADTNGSDDGAFIRYRVTALNGAGTLGQYRLSDGITIDRETPAAPAWIYENNPDADLDADGAVLVTWAPVANTGSGITYNLQKRVDGGDWYDLAAGLTATAFNDTDTFGDETLIEYRVLARNGVGRISGWTLSDGVRVDTDTPASPTGVGEGLTVGSDLDYVNVNTYLVYWTGVAATATGDTIRYNVERNVNGGGWNTAVTGLTAPSWDDPQAYSNGDTIAYRVIAVNGAGTASAASAPSDGLTVDTGQPNSTIATTGYYNAVNWPDRVEGASSDDYSGVAYVQVVIYDTDANLWWDGSAWTAGGPFWLTATGTTNWTYALSDSALTNGHAYDLLSRATDVAGNVETSLGTNTFIFAKSGPEAPVISSETHPVQKAWYNANDPAFAWTTPGGPAPIVGYSYVLDQNPATTPDAVVETTGLTANYIDMADGTWYFHVRALDNAGVWGPAGHYRINIDTATPAVPAAVTEESPDVDWDYDGSVTVYWTAVPNTGSGIVYRLERELSTDPGIWTVLSDTVQNTWYLDPATGYADGTLIRYRVAARNGVGLTGAATSSDGVTVDSDTPATPAWVTENAPDPNDQDYDPDGSVRVYWAAVADTGSGITYRLERRVTVGGIPGSWVEVAAGLSGTSFLDPRANQDGETIHYRVTALNGVGNLGAARTSDGILIDTDTPGTPAEVTENSPDVDWSVDGSVTVFWSGVGDTGSGITCRLEKQVNNGAWTVVPGAEALPGGTTSFPDGGTYNDGDIIRYRVRATNGAGTNGVWRESDGMTIDSSNPAAPGWVREENPDVDYDADGALTVYWAAVSDTGSGITYRLEKELNHSNIWTLLAQGLAGTSYYDGQTQPDGTLVRYRVTAVNGVNTAGASTLSDSITVDGDSPAAPTGVGEGDVVGTDDTFDQDNAFYVFWNAVADTGSGITYDIQKSLNGSAWVAAATGIAETFWEDPTPYSNGDTVRYRVHAVNGAGLEGAWSFASSGLTLDFAPPDSTVTTNGFFNAFNWPGYIQGTASDSLSDVAWVDLTIQRRSDSRYWNGTAWQVGEVWLRAGGRLSWQYALGLAALTDGVTYDVRSRATDYAGNVEVTLGTGSFTFSGSGPQAPVISSATHPVQTAWYANNDPLLTWITPTSAVPVVGYSYSLDQNATTTPDTQPDTAGRSAAFTDVADGIWYFHVRATDEAGNWGPPAHYRINIDTATPAAPTALTEESPDVDWDADGSVTVIWSAVPDTGSGITYRLEQNLNAGLWTLVPGAEALTGTTLTVGGFANGDTVRFRVRATNGVGLSSAWTTSDGVSFDLTTPAVPAGVGEGDVVGTDDDWDQDNTFWVFWTAVPGTPSGITYSVERSRNHGAWEIAATGLTATQWDDPVAYSSGETVAYRVTAHTGAGRDSAASAPSDGIALDFVRPDSTISTNGFYNTFTWPGAIQGTASDNLADVALVDLTIQRQSDGLYWNGTAWGAALTWLRATGTANWQYPFTPGDGQTYLLQSRATDNADNVETTLGTGTFNYSASGPGAPVISSPTHPDPALWYNTNAPTFNWTTPPSGSGINGYSYLLDQTPDTEPDLTADTTGNTRSYTNLADGIWYLHVRAVDNAGNWGPAGHYRVNIDTTAPAAPATLTEESPDVDLDADGVITLFWSAVAHVSPVTYDLERTTDGGATWVSVATGLTATTALDPLTHPDGTLLRYRVRAVDAVALASGWTQSDGVTVDSEVPAAPTGLDEGDVVGIDDAYDQDNTFYVFWNAVPDTGSGILYTVERRVNGAAWQTVQTNYAQTFWEDPQVFADRDFVQYRVTAINGVGTVGPTSTESDGITLDLTAPDTAIGTSGTYGPASWPGWIAGTATDATSGVALVQITLQRQSDGQYWNGVAWGGASVWLLADGTAAWTYTFAPVSGETYNIQSRAADVAGNVEIGYGVSHFTYTTNEPDSAVTTDGLYVGSAWPGQIAGTALAPLAQVDWVDLTLQRQSDGLYWNGTAWGATPVWLRATGVNPWSYPFTPADGETYLVRSRATDAVGNVETLLGNGAFSYDAAAPAITAVIVTSDNPYFYNPGLTADGGAVYLNSRPGEGAGQTLTMEVAFTEPHPASLTGATAFGDTPPAATATPWTVTYTVEAFAGTQSNVLLTVADTLGLTDTAALTFIQDNLPPASRATVVDDATNVTPIVVEWEAGDAASGLREVHLWVKFQPIGAWTDTGLTMSGPSGSFTYTPTQGAGTYYLATVGVDNVGNVEPLPTGFGDDQVDFDNTPPESSITAPLYAITSPIPITWTASFDAKYTYLYYRYGQSGEWLPTIFSMARSGVFEFLPIHGDGYYYLATVAIDAAGNPEAIAQEGKSLTIYDTRPPTSQAVSPTEWDDFTFTVTWAGDDTALGSGIACFDIQVKVGDGPWTDWLTHTTRTEAEFTAVYAGQPDLLCSFRSRAIDRAGHVEAWPDDPNGDTSTLVHFPGSFPGKYRVFLPALFSGYTGVQLPDLVVTDVQVVPAEPTAGVPWDIRITVKNIGNMDMIDGVWVDLYIDPLPQRLPIKPNTPFFDVSTYGGVWWIPSLAAGQSVVLTKDDIPPDWLPYFPDPWRTPGDHTMYVQVDSLDERTSTPPSWARVYESNENNNVYGPLTVHVRGVNSISAQELPPVPPERQPPY